MGKESHGTICLAFVGVLIGTAAAARRSSVPLMQLVQLIESDSGSERIVPLIAVVSQSVCRDSNGENLHNGCGRAAALG